MSAQYTGIVSDLPTDQELRDAILAVIANQYGPRGIKAFAAASGLPYDRVRDHLTGSTNWKVSDLLTYCSALGVTFDDLFSMRDALRATRPTG
jgi:hypothetical protein